MTTHRLSQGIVLTISAEPLELPPQALKLLLRLRQLAGKARRLVTYTQSLATLFNCTTNTIRNWRNVLVEQGYIYWSTNPRTGMTTIMLTEKVEPPSRQAKAEEQRRIDALPMPLPWQKPKPVVLAPDPKPWWKFPAKSAFCLGWQNFLRPLRQERI
jgi:hypothetical protein